jgi:hypothetical protein
MEQQGMCKIVGEDGRIEQYGKQKELETDKITKKNRQQTTTFDSDGKI